MNARSIGCRGITLDWLVAECNVALYSAIESRSVSILAFGSDNLVELLSALVVLVTFVPQLRVSEEGTARWSGVLLIPLCLVVVSDAVHRACSEAKPSKAGVASLSRF